MVLLGVDLAVLVAIALTVVVASAVQRLVGLGLGLLAAPVVTLLEPDLMPALLLVLAAMLPLVTLVTEHDDIDWRGLAWAVPPRVLGTGLGVALLGLFSTRHLGIAVGLMVLAAVVLTVRAVEVPVRPLTLVGAGLVSGVTGTTTSIGGPPMALLYQHRPPREIRTTLAVYFVAGAVLSLAGLLLAGRLHLAVVLLALLLTPCLVVGVLLGKVLAGRVSDRAIRPAVLGVCAASAVVLLVKTLI